jgi:hypothetical protein
MPWASAPRSEASRGVHKFDLPAKSTRFRTRTSLCTRPPPRARTDRGGELRPFARCRCERPVRRGPGDIAVLLLEHGGSDAPFVTARLRSRSCRPSSSLWGVKTRCTFQKCGFGCATPIFWHPTRCFVVTSLDVVLASARPLGVYGQNATPAADLEVDRLEHRWNTSLERCGLLRTRRSGVTTHLQGVSRSARETRETRNEGVPGSSPGVGFYDLQGKGAWVGVCGGAFLEHIPANARSNATGGETGHLQGFLLPQARERLHRCG